MKKNRSTITILCLLLTISIFTLVGCSTQSNKATKTKNQEKTTKTTEPIILAESNWPGIRAKNAISEYVLEKIGYQIESKSVADAVAHKSIASGDLDIHLGSWMPSLRETRKKIEDEVDLVTTNMDQGLYTMAVPKYVWEAGVKSYADLDKYATKFNHKMYVGPTGWASEKTMSKAIKNDIYNLGDWETKNSTQGALMAQIKKSINKKDWILFIGWKPHWINYMFDLKYLKDPENLWESPESRVDTLARQGLKKNRPQIYKFFTQFKIGAEPCNEWIYKIGREQKKPHQVAQTWVAENISTVEKWLTGVKAKNGKPAIKVLKEKLDVN